MRSTTIGEIWEKGAPEDANELYVRLPDHLNKSVLWDWSVIKNDAGEITLFGPFPDTLVPPSFTVYYD